MINVLHLIDALNAGGSERVAVNLTNELSRRGHSVTLCTTWRGGPLQNLISPGAEYFCLGRRFRFDPRAIFRLIKIIKTKQIQIIHAHSSSLLIAVIAKIILPQVKIIWHEHFGELINQKWPTTILYKILTQNVDGIVAVNKSLANWSISSLKVQSKKVWTLANFIIEDKSHSVHKLPGQKRYRIACVSHLRPQKDHLTLIRAMKIVVEKVPLAQLILIGNDYFPDYADVVWSEVSQLGLKKCVTWLGEQEEVQNILSGCTFGVLSSASEGLPLALLDYGLAGLSVVSTNVGECALVLDNGNAGILVPPQSPIDLANGIIFLINNPKIATRMAKKLQLQVQNTYNATRALDYLEQIYTQILSSNHA